MLDRLDAGDVDRARFYGEMALDSGMVTLYYQKAQVQADPSLKNALQHAIQYRQKHPFMRTFQDVDRGVDMEETIRMIVESEEEFR